MTETVTEKLRAALLQPGRYETADLVSKARSNFAAELLSPAAPIASGEALRRAAQNALTFYDGLERGHDEGEARILDELQAALKADALTHPAPSETGASVGVKEALADPVVVHRNMLAGAIAKPSLNNIAHLYPEVQQMKEALLSTLKHFRWPTSAEHETRDKVVAALAHFDNPPMSRAALETGASGTFKIGDRVRKTKGSRWQGRVVGTYSTSLTPEGYCVESETEIGSVQIYPAAALEVRSDG